MLSGQIIGFIGSDARTTSKGCAFNVSTRQKIGNEETTLWISCYLNYNSKIIDYLKSGTQVYVTGELLISTYDKGEGVIVPSVSMSVNKIELLSSKSINK